MGDRKDLHEILKDILGSDYVYFQPPSNIQMKYPCIVYKRDKRKTKFANGTPYGHLMGYLVTYIDDANPDSDIPNKIADLPMCRHTRFYTADHLNHDTFTIFF